MPSERPISRPADRVARRTCVVTFAVFIALLVVPGVFQLAYGFRGGEFARWQAWLREEPQTTEALHRIEEDFNARFFLATTLRHWMSKAGEVRSRGIDTPITPGQYLVVDADGLVPNASPFMSRRDGRPMQALTALTDISHQLRARGIHFIVVPIPAKSSIYPDKVRRNYDLAEGPDLNTDHEAWFAALRSANVEAIDLTKAFWDERQRERAEPAAATFTQMDSHWTWHAIEIAAGAIADRAAPHLQSAQRREGLQRKLGRRPRENDLGSAPEGDVTLETEERAFLLDANGRTVRADDPAAPILLLGDSFANVAESEGSGLAQAIEHATGVPTRSAAVWGGTVRSIRAPLADASVVNKNVRVVVFAFAIRHIITTDWPPVPIAPAPIGDVPPSAAP